MEQLSEEFGNTKGVIRIRKSGAPKELAVPAPLVAPVVLIKLQTH